MGFTFVYVILYIIFTIYLISKGISIWQWCIKYKQNLPQYPKLFRFNGQYKVHVTIIFTFSVVSYFATSHLEMKVDAILTNNFMLQVLVFSCIDFIICIFILVPLFTQSSEVNYKLIYEDDVIDAASLKSIINNKSLVLDYYLNECTAIYNTEDLKYRIIRYSNGNEPISYTVYEVIEEE